MAGLGRRSHYRKHLTDAVLHDYPEPSPGERIAKVVGTRGSNQFEIVVAPPVSSTSPSSTTASATGRRREPKLALLPTKFRKLVWLKRNDFVIVSCGDENDDEGTNGEGKDDGDASDDNEEGGNGEGKGGVRYIISHILYKDQVKHLKANGLWPMNDPFFLDTNHDDDGDDEEDDDDETDDEAEADDNDRPIIGAAAAPSGSATNNNTPGDDGIVYADDYGEDDDLGYFVNTNRLAALKVDDSSESESESD